MQPNSLEQYWEQFDALRFARLEKAVDFVEGYSSNEELFADVANILMLMFAANQMIKMPQGFKPDTK